jgi:hypothetical protein
MGEVCTVGRSVLQRVFPFQANFQQLKNWRRAGSLLVYSIGVLSIVIPLIRASHSHKSFAVSLLPVLSFLNYFFIISYYVVDIVAETFAYPAAARLRRLGLIDNSLGSKFLGKELTGYFTNDPIPPGPYKLAVNCFENCFFTYNIAKAMTPFIVAKNAIFAGTFLVLAYFGITNSLVGLPILQILLSSLFITELIHHLNFIAKLRGLLDRFKRLFTERKKAARGIGILPDAILLLLEYETTLAYNKSPLSDRIYLKLSDQLSKEWEELKAYYVIC